MKRVAVLGASGFIGARIVEMVHLANAAEVRPVLRATSRLGRLSDFMLDCRVADAFDQEALTAAFSGCDVVIDAVAGAPEVISGTVKPVYGAAERAGVRRLVYLSTASVHGQRPKQGTNEDTPLNDKQPLPYNNAKVKAERTLQRLRKRGNLELVILRPGIVFGPRSFWVSSFADALVAGKAYLTNNGQGICNSIYVDNLVHAIQLAMTMEGIDGEAFLLGDSEQVRWSDLYRPIAKALGFNLSDVARVEPVYTKKGQTALQAFRESRTVRAAISLCPAKVRRALSAGLASFKRKATAMSPREAPPPGSSLRATLEMSLLYDCDYKLPHDKASRLLGYDPPVSFPEGCRRSVGWLAFAGYPVKYNPGNTPNRLQDGQ